MRDRNLSNRAALLALLLLSFGFFAEHAPEEPALGEVVAERTVVELLGDWSPRWTLDTPAAPAPAARPADVVPVPVLGAAGPFEAAAGEVLLHVADGADPDAVEAGLRALSAATVQRSAQGLWRVSFNPTLPLPELIDLAASVDGVAGARVNAITRAASCGSFDLAQHQWEQPLIAGNTACAEDSGLDRVTIAVLDTGVAYEDHSDATGTYVQVPELAGVPIVAPYDFVDDDAHANDDNGHGTHLAGLIASNDRLHGHAPSPTLMPIRVLDADRVGTEWSLVQGLHWAADHGAQVVNLSLTFGVGYLPSSDLIHAIEACSEAGAIVLAASGNSDLDEVPYPAALPGVLAVASARLKDDDKLKYVEYSNRGFAVDLSAPGGDRSRDDNDDGIPDGMIAQSISPDDPTEIAYWAMAGTSQATAVASGQVSWALAEGLDPAEIPAVLALGRGALDGYSDGSWDRREESGDGVINHAGLAAYADPATRVDVPDLYVNVLQSIKDKGDGKFQALVRAHVVDGTGTPVKDVEVMMTFRGSTASSAREKTDDQGIAELESDEIDLGDPNAAVFWVSTVDGLRIDLSKFSEVLDGKIQVQPGGFYGLSEGNASLMAAALDSNPGAGLIFKLDPDQLPDDCAPFKCDEMRVNYTARSLGGGFAGSIINATFNDPWFKQVGGAGFAGSIINVDFSRPVWFPWGSSDEGSYEVYDLDGSGFAGSIINVMRYDPSLWGSGFAGSIINVLAYDPKVKGTGFADANLVHLDGDSDPWGSGFAGSIINVLKKDAGWSYGGGFAGSIINARDWNVKLLGSGFAGSIINAYSWKSSLSAASVDEIGVQVLGASVTSAPVDLD